MNAFNAHPLGVSTEYCKEDLRDYRYLFMREGRKIAAVARAVGANVDANGDRGRIQEVGSLIVIVNRKEETSERVGH